MRERSDAARGDTGQVQHRQKILVLRVGVFVLKNTRTASDAAMNRC